MMVQGYPLSFMAQWKLEPNSFWNKSDQCTILNGFPVLKSSFSVGTGGNKREAERGGGRIPFHKQDPFMVHWTMLAFIPTAALEASVFMTKDRLG